MNIFERASRAKLRFETPAGLMTTEQLWDLPLTHNVKPNLDAIAIAARRALREQQDESLVNPVPNKAVIDAELRYDILKHIIESKLKDKAAAEKAAQTRAEVQRTMEALDAKKTDELKSLSREQLEARLKELSASAAASKGDVVLSPVKL